MKSDSSMTAVLGVARVVAGELNLKLRAPQSSRAATLATDEVQAIARASRVRARRVMLRGDWWKTDAGPLLAFREADNEPVALLQPSSRRYDLVDASGKRERVREDVASGLKPGAYMFLPSFGDRILTPLSLWRLGRAGTFREFFSVIGITAAIGALTMVTPILTQLLVDEVLPYSRHRDVGLISATLIALAGVCAAFGFVRGLGMLRLETRIELNTEAAIMDRLLRLPARFFRNYNAGSLAERVLGIVAIRRAVTGSQILGILSGLFSAASLLIILYYDARLALVAVGLGVVVVGVVLTGSVIGLRYRRQVEATRGELSGLLLQLLSGVTTLRVAAAERRGFHQWAQRYVKFQRQSLQAGVVENSFGVFRLSYPILSSIFFFAAIYWFSLDQPEVDTGLSAGAFFATITALGQFLLGLLGLGATVVSVLAVVPQYERIRPILEAPLEVQGQAADPGDLSGAVALADVKFRYDPSGPWTLDGVNVTVRPGQMVALVGPSGSGKSTALRLLLGLEQPDAGRILYDGRDLHSLDIEAVRSQVGVVLQSGRLLRGDLLSNIVGHWKLRLEDAWAAARKVGLEDDIRALPMQMHTPVGDAMSTFSAGQQQRLRIARAIVHDPPILFLDEATSALDNRTQDVVAKSLGAMAMARLVIAHRLSTIRHADCIYYLESGRVVESGTYEELMRQDGRFAKLASRQLIYPEG